MNVLIEQGNAAGEWFVRFAWPMLIQSSFLIAAIFLLDRLLRTRARAALRYCLWLLVLAKLLLPASLAAPTGVGYWIGGEFLSPTPPAIPSEPAPVPAPPAITLDNPPAGPALAPQNPPAISPIAPPPAPSAESPLSPAPPVVAAPPHVAPVPPIIIPPVALSWRAYVLLAWSAVAVAMGLLVIQRTWFIGSLVAGAGEAGGELHSLLAACRQRVGLRRPVGLKLSAVGVSPAVCGLWRPVILIPAHLVGALGPRQMEAVLLHELAHVKRGDLWVNALQVLLQIAYFYNPFLWLANAALRRVREQAVDEAVQVALGDAAVDYPAALVDVARLSLSRPALSLRLIGVVESRGALESRIRRLLSRPLPRTAKLGLTGLLFVLAAAAILLPMAKGQFGPERGPLGGLFEYGPSSGEGLTLKVGPNTFSLRAVARRLDAGPVRAEDGRGRSVSMKGLAWPVFPVHRRADQPTDAVAFYLEPDVSRFDIIEPRVFDHLSREILNGKAGIQISAGVDGVISIQSTGGALPDRVDLWLRAHSYAQDNLPVILAASEGAAVQLGKSRIKLAALRGDVTGVTKVNYQPGHTAHSGYDILWQTNPSGARNDEFFVVFEQSGTWDLGQYQVCAVDKNGFKHFAGSPHYIDFTKNGGPEIIVFRIPLANLDHFEWRPFGGRHRFFFDGVRLPTDGKPRAQPWQVALPCGATVELIGLSESPSQGKPWWRPDGSPLAEAPYAKMGAKAFPQENQVARECAIRLSNLPNESVGSRWEFRSGSYSGGSPVNADGKSIDDLRAIALTTSAAADRITIRYGVASGPWRTVTAGMGSTGSSPADEITSFSPASETAEGVVVSVAHNVSDQDIRVIAVDKAGKQTLAGRSVGASVGAVRQITSTFPGLRLADVKEFQFQVRPYAWAQFKDIALRPATQPAAGLIPALIGQLGSASAKEREEAQKTLVEIGEPAIDSLRLATADKDLERAARAKEALRLISAQGDNAKLDQFRTAVAPYLEALSSASRAYATRTANQVREGKLDLTKETSELEAAKDRLRVAAEAKWPFAVATPSHAEVEKAIKASGTSSWQAPRAPWASAMNAAKEYERQYLAGQVTREEAATKYVEVSKAYPAFPVGDEALLCAAQLYIQRFREGDKRSLADAERLLRPLADREGAISRFTLFAETELSGWDPNPTARMKDRNALYGKLEASKDNKWFEKALPAPYSGETPWQWVERIAGIAVTVRSMQCTTAQNMVGDAELSPDPLGNLKWLGSQYPNDAFIQNEVQIAINRVMPKLQNVTGGNAQPAPLTAPGSATQSAASRIPALIGQLGSASAKEREEAQKALVEIGPEAVAPLEAARGDKDLERATRAGHAIERIESNRVSWGQAVDGLQVGLRIDNDRRSFRIGQTIPISFVVRNVGAKNLVVDYSRQYGLGEIPAPYGLRVLDSRGKNVYCHFTSLLGGAQEFQAALEPGKSLTVHSNQLALRPMSLDVALEPGTLLTEPGILTISQMDVNSRAYDHRGFRFLGGLTTGRLEVEVLPPRPDDPIAKAIASRPPAGQKASTADTAAALSAMAEYVQLWQKPFSGGGGLDPAAYRALESQCQSLTGGAVNFLGQVAASHSVALTRKIAAELLGMTGQVQAVDWLFKALGDESAEVRSTTARALENFRRPEVIQRVLQVLQADKDADVRASAAFALGHLGSRTVTRDLLNALKSETDPHALEGIFTALSWLKDPSVIPALQKLRAESENPRFVELVDHTIRNINDPGYTGTATQPAPSAIPAPSASSGQPTLGPGERALPGSPKSGDASPPQTQPAADRIQPLIGQLGSASAKEREEAQKTPAETVELPEEAWQLLARVSMKVRTEDEKRLGAEPLLGPGTMLEDHMNKFGYRKTLDLSGIVFEPIWSEGFANSNETLVMSNPLTEKATGRKVFIFFLFKRWDDLQNRRLWLPLVSGFGDAAWREQECIRAYKINCPKGRPVARRESLVPPAAASTRPEGGDPSAAIREFGVARSEPIHTGYFFFRGAYVDAPYVVERRGLDTYINNCLVRKGPAWPRPIPESELRGDPGDPPRGAKAQAAYWNDKWRWLSANHDFPKAIALLAEAYHKSEAFGDVQVKADGRAADITLTPANRQEPAVTKTFVSTSPLADAQHDQEYCLQRLAPNSVLMIETGGAGEISMGGRAGLGYLRIIASGKSADEKQKAFEAEGLVKGPAMARQFAAITASAQLAQRLDEEAQALPPPRPPVRPARVARAVERPAAPRREEPQSLLALPADATPLQKQVNEMLLGMAYAKFNDPPAEAKLFALGLPAAGELLRLATIKTENTEMRDGIRKLLARFPGDQAREIVEAGLLTDPKPIEDAAERSRQYERHYASLHILRERRDRASVPALVKSLAAVNAPDEKRTVIMVLGEVGDPAAAAAIRPYLGDADEMTRSAATGALIKLNAIEMTPELRRRYGPRQPEPVGLSTPLVPPFAAETIAGATIRIEDSVKFVFTVPPARLRELFQAVDGAASAPVPIGVMGGGFRWPGTDPLIIVSLKDGSEVRIMMAVKATPPFCLVTGNKPVFDSPKLAALVNETIRAGLVARLGEGDFVKKYQAAAALFDRGDPDGRDVLVEALKPGQPTALRAGAAMRLLKGHDAQALKTADDLAGAADLSGSDGQRLIRAVADGAGVQDGVPILKKFWAVPILKKFWLEGKFPLHERTAIQGLGKIASPEAIDVLIDVWDSGPEFQMQLVYTAGRYFQQGEKDQARDWWQKNRGRPRMELLADGYVTDTQGHGHGYSCLEEMKKLDPATALRELMRRLPDANGQECQRITKGLQMLSGVPLGDDKSLWLAWWRSNAQTRPASVPTAP